MKEASLKNTELKMRALITFSLILSIELHAAILSEDLPKDKNIIPLEKIGEICVPDEMGCFLKITGICVDKHNNLYVADSERNKIFKFNSKGDLQYIIGEFGQGPGEFLGNTHNCYLEISYGNDDNLYIVDSCNKRISVFSTNGILLKSFNLRNVLYDSAAVNSRGDIYILSHSGLKALERRDINFRFKDYLFDYEDHLQFPHGEPIIIGKKPAIPYEYRRPNKLEIIKLMMKNDNLAVLSNYSWKVLIFDLNNNVTSQFSIEDKELIKDFKNQLIQMKNAYAKQSKKKKNRLISAYIAPFKAFLLFNNDICFVYEDSAGYIFIYQYRTDGTLIHRYVFPDKIHGHYFACSSSGIIFVTTNKRTKIAFYQIKTEEVSS